MKSADNLFDKHRDQLTTTLQNVQAIAAHVFGSVVQIFVAGEGESGITQFSLDLSSLGLVRTGTKLSETISGGAVDDILFGNRGNDILNGGAGNDRLIDGTGKDRMTGGSGQDVFVFKQDGRADIVTDFVLGEDRIDLSD